jgi:hypothetical protein
MQPRPAHDDDTHGRVALGLIQRLADLAQHRLAQRVGALRPVERDARNAVDDLVQDGGELHVVAPQRL